MSHLCHRQRSSRTPCCTSSVSTCLRPRLIILLLSIAVVILIPAFFPSCVIRYRPRFMKSAWDALTIILILFAVIAGFLAQVYENARDGGDTPVSSTSCGGREWTKKCTGLGEELNFRETLTDPLLSLPSSPREFLHIDSAAKENLQRLVPTEKTSSSCLDENNVREDKDCSNSMTIVDQKEKKEKSKKTTSRNKETPDGSLFPAVTRRSSSILVRLFSDKKKATRSDKRVHSFDIPVISRDLSSGAVKRVRFSIVSQRPGGLLRFEKDEMGQRREEKSPGFCASPDVNSKADSFIASLRAGWQREKLDAMEDE